MYETGEAIDCEASILLGEGIPTRLCYLIPIPATQAPELHAPLPTNFEQKTKRREGCENSMIPQIRSIV